LVARERIAPIGGRMISFDVDDIVACLLFMAIFYDQIAGLNGPQAIRFLLQVNLLVLILLKIPYHPFFIGYNGMTLGKYLAEIRAVSPGRGELQGFPRAFVRAVVGIPDEMFFSPGGLPAFVSPPRRTLHDRVSGCVVVYA